MSAGGRRGSRPAAGHPGALDQRARQRGVQRRQRHGAVGHHLHRRAALAEQDHGAKHRVDMAPTISSCACGICTMACTVKPSTRASGRSCATRCQHGLRRGAHVVWRRSGSAPRRPRRTCARCRRQDLEHHRKADATRPARPRRHPGHRRVATTGDAGGLAAPPWPRARSACRGRWPARFATRARTRATSGVLPVQLAGGACISSAWLRAVGASMRAGRTACSGVS
jgi:hypothetical protein